MIDPGLVVGPATRDLVAQMCELGWLFKRVGAYVDAHNFDTLGLVGQALCASLQDELTDYYRLIAVLEAQPTSHRMPCRGRRRRRWHDGAHVAKAFRVGAGPAGETS